MLIRFPAMPTWILSVLILSAICPGCARRNILFESKKDPMPCEEFGGKVSMTMRAEPVAPDRGLRAPRSGMTVQPTWSEPVPTPRPQPPIHQAPSHSGPMFFGPPGLGMAQRQTVVQVSFHQDSTTENSVFASYAGALPYDPAYGQPPPAEPVTSAFAPPQLIAEPLDTSDPMDEIASYSRTRRSCLGEMWFEAKQNVCCDYGNYYDRETMAKLACGLVLGSVLANTSMDQDVQDWYQQDVRSEETDNFAEFWKSFGEGHIFIPAFACLAFAGKFVEDRPILGPVGEFGARSTRAYLVGTPPMLFMQFMLGASRPGETDHSSHWVPFRDTNAVSGHAFTAAVPFITAARMTDSFVLKSGLYACSTLTGISRINDDSHYLSQAILGWWMAYLACEAVDQTQLNRHGMTFMPIASSDLVGFGAICKY